LARAEALFLDEVPLLRAIAIRVLLASGVAIASLAAHAAGTYSLAIGATVLSKSNCKFTSAAGSVLAFGTIDPSTTTNKTASTVLTINCGGSAATASYSITANDGLYASGPGQPRLRQTVTTVDFMPYTLSMPVTGTATKNTATNVTITGTITVANFQNAIAGNYSDTVVLTLSP
jgi:hypothetical protein